MHESNISLKAILRTGNTGYVQPCGNFHMDAFRVAEGPSWPKSLPSVLHRSPPKGSARQGLRRSPPARGETLGWRSISPTMHRYRAALQVLLILSPSPLTSTSRSSLPSLCHTLFSLRRGEHALGHYVCAPPVAQERREFGRGGQKKVGDQQYFGFVTI